MKINILYLFATIIMFSSCAVQNNTTRAVAYKKLYDEKSLSILALPPINKSVKVEAKEIFYSSLVAPLAERGYYVLPPLLSMAILKEESAYDSEMFLNNSMTKVGQLFGADAVLFTIIHDWSKTTITSQIRVEIEYILKSTATDEILFQRKGKITLTKQTSSGSGLGALVQMVANMVETALTNEVVAGRQCNYYTLSDLPAGKYHPQYEKDGTFVSGAKEFDIQLYY